MLMGFVDSVARESGLWILRKRDPRVTLTRAKLCCRSAACDASNHSFGRLELKK